MAVGWALLLGGCNVVETDGDHDARLTRVDVKSGSQVGVIDCWVTMEFGQYPHGGSAKDVVLRFYSDALVEPAEFDWVYIASHDVRQRDGGGVAPLRATRPDSPPPLDRPIRVRFPLAARSEPDPSPTWLQTELYWGRRIQHAVRDSIQPATLGAETPSI